MKHILITGATGNIGQNLVLHLLKNQYRVSIVTRNLQKARRKLALPISIIETDLSKSKISASDIQDIDCVINLAKESLVSKSLTKSRQRQILDKSYAICKNLVDSFDYEVHFIHISGTSCYKESQFPVTENSPLSDSFFGELAKRTQSVFDNYKSTVIRLPLVISNSMPIIKTLTYLYRFMVAPKVLSSNLISWVHTEDICRSICKIIESPNHRERINIVAGSSSLKDLHRVFCDLTNRINPLFIPAFLLKRILKTKSKMILTNSEVNSIHSQFLDLTYTRLEDCLALSLNYMKTPTLRRSRFHYEFKTFQFIPRPIEDVFDFFKEAKNLEEITPKKLNFKIIDSSSDNIEEGSRFDYRLKLNGVPFRWRTYIKNWNPPMGFIDYQDSGPYQVWYHCHSFYKVEGGTLMIDDVKYRLPFGIFGDILALWYVTKNIKEIFNYRYKYIDGVFGDE